MKKIFIALTAIILLIGVYSCTKKNKESDNPSDTPIVNPDTPDEKVTIDNIKLNVPTSINSSIKLVDQVEEIYIQWESSNPNVLNEFGCFFMPEEATTITLTAHLTSGNKTRDISFDIDVNLSNSDPFTMAYRTFAGKIKKEYTKNAQFYEMEYRTFKGQFESMNKDVMDDTGKIYQTSYDQDVVIKLTITNTETEEIREYYIMSKVKEYSNNSYISLISEWVEEKVNLLSRGEIDKLPTKHDLYESKIEWIGGLKTFVSVDGTIVRPIERVTDTIKCKITYGDTIISKSYVLEDFGGATETEFLDQWLEYIMPKSIKAHHNYVKYNVNDYYFHHQVECQEGGVLNLLTGKELEVDMTYYNDVIKNNELGIKQNKLWYNLYHRGIEKLDQSALDAIFGSGYVIPNEDNVIWIVVHESGMARPKEDALCLADSQKRNLTRTDYREASWQYQVDEGVIYQSFPDSIEAWHAGGNYNAGPHWPYGNTNGIGIEMCINADGNYDGAMHMDTKLVANLVHKYNLQIENVARHYDFAGKNCPAYMNDTLRWDEFRQLVNMELYAIKYLRDAEVIWTVSNLDTLFTKSANELYYAKKVTEETPVTIKLEVTKGEYHFEKEVVVNLIPDDVDLSVWAIE